MIKRSHNSYKYVYDPHWANYLVLNGAKVMGIGLNKRTGKVFIAFDYESTQEIYAKFYESKNSTNTDR